MKPNLLELLKRQLILLEVTKILSGEIGKSMVAILHLAVRLALPKSQPFTHTQRQTWLNSRPYLFPPRFYGNKDTERFYYVFSKYAGRTPVHKAAGLKYFHLPMVAFFNFF